MAAELKSLECAICLKNAEDPLFLYCCQKLYCKNCIEEWKQLHNQCPTCRKTIITVEMNTFCNLINEVYILKMKRNYLFVGY
jgi:hypothetical protein